MSCNYCWYCRSISTWTSYSLFFECFYKWCLCKMCRWLCKMLCTIHIIKCKDWILVKSFSKCISFFIIIISLVYRHKSIKNNLWCWYCKYIFTSSYSYRSCLILCRCHLTRNKSLPYKLIKSELISLQWFLN